MARTLIPRIEQATAEQVRELLEEALEALFPKPAEVWKDGDRGGWTDEYSAWQAIGSRFLRLLDAEAWTSAAEMLVPEGMLAMTVNCGIEDRKAPDFSKATAFVGQRDDVGGEPCQAATPALALAAACLRASLPTALE